MQTVPLAGNHPVFERSLVRGGLDPSATLTLSVVFGLRNRPGLETLQAEQQDPTSSNFRQWLTPEEFNVRFGPDPADVEAVSDWLVQQGFAIVESNQNARYVRFRGSVAQVQSVFRTSVVSVGDALFANTDDPHIPARFDGVIASIAGLHNLRAAVSMLKQSPPGPLSQARLDAWNGTSGNGAAPVVSQPFVTIGGITAFGPSDLYTFYDFNPLFTGGTTGSGDCIAIVGDSDYLASAVALFNTTFGLAAETINTVLSSNKNGTFTNPGRNGDEGEALLDLEWVHAAAPGAPVKFYLGDGGNTNNGAINDAMQKAITDNQCAVISVSFGVCSSDPSGLAAEFNTMLTQAAMQGQTVLVASGDTGAAGLAYDPAHHTCNTTHLNVSQPADNPNVTAVGGTGFTPTYDGSGNDTSTVNDTTRQAWNADGGSTGGGASTNNTKPSYQSGVTPNDGQRDVPDIAMLADPLAPGVFTGDDHSNTAQMGCCTGGTSLAAPVMAGIVKLLEQQGGSRLGALNPLLYSLAGTNGAAHGFRDVTLGNNTFNSVSGFTAGPDYDQCTGWGEVDANVFVNTLAGPTATPTQVGFCGGTNATCTPTATATPTSTPEDSGLVPPNKDVAKCEAGVANNVKKLASCIRKCHIKAATARFKMKTFDEEACESADPQKSCRAKYDAKQTKLLAKGTCPMPCLDAAHQATLADQAEADLDASNGALYCFGTVALGGDDTGFVPDANTLTCEAGVAKNVSKHESCIRKCHIKAAAKAFKLKVFDEEACEETNPAKSCRAKYDAKQATLLAPGNTCPACLDAAHQATLADQLEAALDAGNGALYCAGAQALPTSPPTPTQTPTSTPSPPFVRALAIDPSMPSTLYAATDGMGIYQSTNSGGSWSAINSGLSGTALYIFRLAIDPSTPSTLYAASSYDGVYQSTNSGGSWSAVNSGLSGTALGIFDLAIDPSTPSTLYAGTLVGVFQSTNSGGSWNAVSTGLSGTSLRVVVLAIDPSTPSTLYAGTDGDGPYRTTNSGGSWSAVNSGLFGNFLFVIDLAIDPSTPSTLYAETGGSGVFRSTNSGGSWTEVTTGLGVQSLNGLVIDPSTPSTLYVAASGPYKSTNSGGNWSPANTGLGGNALGASALAIDPSTPSTLYFGTYAAGIYKSTNSGGSWSAVNTGLGG